MPCISPPEYSMTQLLSAVLKSVWTILGVWTGAKLILILIVLPTPQYNPFNPWQSKGNTRALLMLESSLQLEEQPSKSLRLLSSHSSPYAGSITPLLQCKEHDATPDWTVHDSPNPQAVLTGS